MAEKSSFMGEESSFKGKKSSFSIFDKIEFHSKRTKNKPDTVRCATQGLGVSGHHQK